MQIIVERSLLNAALSGVTKVIHGRQVPILSCVLLRAGALSLTVTATDNDTTLIRKVEAATTQTGVAAVDALKLSAIANNLQQGSQVELKRVGDVLKVRSGRSHYTLACLDETQYPEVKPVGVETFSVDSDDLARALKFATVATASDGDQTFLKGVCWERLGDRLAFTGTDKNHLHSTSIGAPVLAEFAPIVVPRSACDLISALAASAEEQQVTLRITDRLIEAETDHCIVRSKLLDTAYPPWREVLPKPVAGSEIAVKRSELLDGVKRVLPLAAVNGKSGQYLFLRSRGNSLMLVGVDPHLPEIAVDEIDAAVTGPGIPGNAFYVRLLADSLGAVDGEDMTLHPIPNDSGLIFRIDGERKEDTVYVIGMTKMHFPEAQLAQQEIEQAA